MARRGRKLTNIGGFYKKDYTDPLKSYKVGRNDTCPCGSGEKYKKCCGSEDLSAIERWWRQRKLRKILDQKRV